jgi:hypothetical protein
MPSSPDWKALDAHLLAALLGAVRAHHDEHPDHRIYAAAFHNFYAETGGVIAWPSLAIATEEDLRMLAAGSSFTEDDLRWSPADWTTQLDPSESDDAWAAEVERAAGRRDDAYWNAQYDRFLRAFASAAKKARPLLVAEKVVEKDFIAVAMDEAWDLVPLSLTPAQVRRHFPELDEEAQELARLDALPASQRAEELADILDSPTPGAVSAEAAMRILTGLGTDAVGVAVTRIARSRDRWRYAKLLADLGVPSPEAIDALADVLRGKRLSEPDRAWAGAALARLGRLDLVLADRDRIPRAVLRRALAAPFTSFRDHVAIRRPLDYAPLESALSDDPALADEMLDELSPGSGYCTLEPDEVDTARDALTSSFEVVRRHAAFVLEDAGI